MNLNQALQEKFPHLEVSVLKLSEAQKDNETKRIDSEYFKKEYMLEIKKLLNIKHYKLNDIASVNGGKRLPIEESFTDDFDGIPYIRAEDIKNGFVEFENSPKISKKLHNKLSKYCTYYNDVLLTIVGNSIGDIGIVKFKLERCNLTENCVRLINIIKINPETLFVFLKSYLGQFQIKRESVGTAQPKLALERIRDFLIPLFPMPFQLEIEKLVKDSHSALEDSKALYKQAEDLLYTELGLNPQNPMQSILQSHSNNINFRIATLKESFLKTGRLDSEYYQVKYEEIESFIQSYQDGFSKLEIAEIKDSNFTPKAKEKYRYIELANIGANGNISTPLEELGEDLPTRARRLVKEGDLIISSVEGSLGSCALITKEFHHCVVSTGFYVLKSHSINSETLLVLFKSSFFQHYLKKFPSGTILSAISKEELQNILIPKIDSKIQESIAQHIQKKLCLTNRGKKSFE